MQQTDLLLSSSLPPAQTALLHKTILLLLEIYHSLNSQDLPEFFEDRLSTFMALLIKYLDYSPIGAPALGSGEEDEEEEAGDLENIKSEICEIASLYSLRYLDVFGEGGYLGPFVERTWGLLTKVGLGVKYDVVSFFASFSRLLSFHFLSTLFPLRFSTLTFWLFISLSKRPLI